MLEDLLGSKTRAAVLGALLERPGSGVHVRELVRRAGGSVSGVQREVDRLVRLGLAVSKTDERGRRQVSLVGDHPFADALAGLVAAESQATYSPSASPPSRHSETLALLNPRVRGSAASLVEVCRAYGAVRVALFGSATQSDPGVVPHDLDVSVRFDPRDVRSRAERYFGLKESLERLTGMRVDLREAGDSDNPYLKREIERTEVVLYEAP